MPMSLTMPVPRASAAAAWAPSRRGATSYLSEQAIAKHIGAIFTKLDLAPTPDDNRRVLAVLAYLHNQP
jgi:hypothetical protein